VDVLEPSALTHALWSEERVFYGLVERTEAIWYWRGIIDAFECLAYVLLGHGEHKARLAVIVIYRGTPFAQVFLN
jgi:hypothetical protein